VVSRRVISFLVLAIACVAPGSAGAAAASGALPHGPLLGTEPPSPRAEASPKLLAESGGDLIYHGGPVMHRSSTYAIFWTGPEQLMPPAFEAGMTRFLEAVAGESGSHGNVYSVPAEYGDSSAVAAYDSQFGGAFKDTSPLPSGGCAGPFYSACISDGQIREHLDSFLAAGQMPRDLRSLYLLFLPPGYDTCGGTSCAYTKYCGYHYWFGSGRSWTIYAMLPWMDPHCLGPYAPNGLPALDRAASVVSHEQIEAYTDPLGTGWADAASQEIADKCTGVYGQPLGSTPFDAFNQQIGTGSYALQLEWSNAAGGCVPHSDAAPPSPPANDLFANAQVLEGTAAERAADTTFEAGKEAGEPNHAGNEGGGSVWYSWTPRRLGVATVSTAGSSFDTLLGVYTGSDVARLTQVAAGDDYRGSQQSVVSFIARPGTPYRLAVDGFNLFGEPTGGTVHLSLSEEPAPDTRIRGRHRITTGRRRARVRFGLFSQPRASGFECKLDRRPFRRCRRRPVLAAGPGRHLLKARAIGALSLRDPLPARFAFFVRRR
jgi:hypothetical protein